MAEKRANQSGFVESLSPKELAGALGVSESSVKRWVDDGRLHAGKTAGGHRRIGVAEAVRFARQSGIAIARPGVLGLPELAAAGRGGEPTGEAAGGALYELLVRGDEPSARALILGAFLRGEGVADLIDGPVAKAMARVGELWEHAPSGIAVEHRATDVALGIVNELRRLVQPAIDNGSERPVALGCAPAGDPYLIPSMAAAAVVAEAGFRAVNLGPDTPLASLVEACGRERPGPRLVWVSFSGTATVFPPRREWEGAIAELRGLGAAAVLGGRAMPREVREAAQGYGPGVVVCATMRELRAFAEGVRGRDAGGEGSPAQER